MHFLFAYFLSSFNTSVHHLIKPLLRQNTTCNHCFFLALIIFEVLLSTHALFQTSEKKTPQIHLQMHLNKLE